MVGACFDDRLGASMRVSFALFRVSNESSAVGAAELGADSSSVSDSLRFRGLGSNVSCAFAKTPKLMS